MIKKILLVIVIVIVMLIISAVILFNIFVCKPIRKAEQFDKIGQYEQAIQEYKKAMKFLAPIDPRYRNIQYIIAFIYGRLGKYEDAESICRGILSLDPNDAKAYVILGYVYGFKAGAISKTREELRNIPYEMELLQKATDCFKKAFELNPSEMSKDEINLMKTIEDAFRELEETSENK